MDRKPIKLPLLVEDPDPGPYGFLGPNQARSQKLNKEEAIPSLAIPSPLFSPIPFHPLFLHFTPFPLVSKTSIPIPGRS